MWCRYFVRSTSTHTHKHTCIHSCDPKSSYKSHQKILRGFHRFQGLSLFFFYYFTLTKCMCSETHWAPMLCMFFFSINILVNFEDQTKQIILCMLVFLQYTICIAVTIHICWRKMVYQKFELILK